MLGNTAFLSDVTYTVGIETTSIDVTIRNDATIAGGARNYFWSGQTRVFVELLPLVPGNLTFAALQSFGTIDWTHSVWPIELLTETAVAAGAVSCSLARHRDTVTWPRYGGVVFWPVQLQVPLCKVRSDVAWK